jgi:predicted N-acyltransferase
MATYENDGEPKRYSVVRILFFLMNVPMLAITPCDSADAIPHDVWARLCPPGSPFLNADFLKIIERHGAAGRDWGWVARHLVASNAQGVVVGVLPLYVRFNSHGDFIHDWSWASAYQQLGHVYYPKLLSGLPHTPAAGPRFLVSDGAEALRIRRVLIDGAMALAGEYGASSWHVAFPDEADLDALQGAGLLVSHNVQFHWLNNGCGDFDGYLATFAAEKRRKVRAERRRVRDSGLLIEVRHGDEVDSAEWPALHALYASTFEKFNNHAVFTAACFADLAKALGRRMVLFIARDGGQPVALSLCFRSDEVLYGRYWGCNGSYHSLHFELCFYQGIAYCLREGLLRFEPGAGGEHKIARGFTPTVVHSAHWIADPAMRTLIGRHLAQQSGAVLAYREEAADHLPFRSAG